MSDPYLSCRVPHRNANPPVWTPERIAALRAMWKDGVQCAIIAEQLGDVSRHAVIGKARREGLGPHKGGQKSGRPRSPRPAAASPRPPKAARFPRPWVPRPPPEPEPLMIATVHLQEHHCRWPIGDPKRLDFGFCGHNRARGSSYCSAHAAIAANRS